MSTVLDDIRFLSDSEHRLVALEELMEEPRTQPELREATGASSATVSRLIRSFGDRQWIGRDRSRYELTPLGWFVTEEFRQFRDRMESAHQLRSLLEWLPPDLLALGVHRLADARVTFPSPSAPLAPMERATDLKYAASRSRSLSYLLPTPCLGAHWESIVAGKQTLEAVYSPELFEAIAHSDSAAQFVDILESERATASVLMADVPCIVGINDDVVYVFVVNDRGVPLALIETEDEVVFSWAEEVFESCRREAVPVTADEFVRLRDGTLRLSDPSR